MNWQTALRAKLDLTPERNDVLSKLLWDSICSANTFEDFEASIQNHIEELQRALKIAVNV